MISQRSLKAQGFTSRCIDIIQSTLVCMVMQIKFSWGLLAVSSMPNLFSLSTYSCLCNGLFNGHFVDKKEQTELESSVYNADWSILNRRKKNTNGVVGDGLKKYCESWRINVEVNNIRGFDVVPQECVEHIKKYMTSSQYKADSERALEEVTLYLSSSCCCTLEGDGKDAWIFDVDDTLLSTIPYFKKHGFGGEKLNATSLETWMKESKAPALEHTLKLFHDIKDRGFKIFLISSRRETLRSPSVDNLIKVGYHGWTNLVLRGLEDEFMEVQKYKSEARHRLIDEGYRIWGIIGDQWSSFEGLPIAKRTFKLPNSMYYV